MNINLLPPTLRKVAMARSMIKCGFVASPQIAQRIAELQQVGKIASPPPDPNAQPPQGQAQGQPSPEEMQAIQQAAQQGDPQAQQILAQLQQQGGGQPQDPNAQPQDPNAPPQQQPVTTEELAQMIQDLAGMMQQGFQQLMQAGAAGGEKKKLSPAERIEALEQQLAQLTGGAPPPQAAAPAEQAAPAPAQ